jgi:HAE1 family hydrophobic/amphiphilic exporter-1
VDEAEFEVNINGPEGTNLAVMNETMQQVEKDIMSTPGVRMVLTNAGGSFLGGVNQGGAYVRIAPHEERTLSIGRIWTETLKGNPLKAFRGNYTQQDVMTEVRKRLQKYAPMRAGVRNAQSFNFGTGGRFDIDFALRGPELEKLSDYAEELGSARQSSAASSTSTLR